MARCAVLTVVGLVSAAILSVSALRPDAFFPGVECNVRDWGAVGDATTDDTQAFLNAWRQCTTVTVPQGNYSIASLLLSGRGKSLHLQNGAKLLASPTRDKYGPTQPDWYSVALQDCESCSLTGEGDATIDGQSELWVLGWVPNDRKIVANWDDPSCPNWKQCRPRLLGVRNSAGVSISDIRIVNSVFWTTHIINSTDVALSNLFIRGDYNVPNNDGIDIDSSVNVVVRNVDIDSADDGICIKSTQLGRPVQNVLVSGGRAASRSAAIKFGSESHGDFHNITIEDIEVRPSHRAIGVQLRDQGSMSAITVRNIRLTAQWERRTWWGAAEAIVVSRLIRHHPPAPGTPGALHDMLFSNISGASEAGVVIVGGDDTKIDHIRLENVDLQLKKLTDYHGGYRDLRPGPADLEDAAPGALYTRNVRKLEVVNSSFRVLGGDQARTDWGAAWQVDRGVESVDLQNVFVLDER